MHLAEASHFCRLLHESASSSLVTFTQAPPAPVQLSHGPQACWPQQAPSTQKPLTQLDADAVVQVSPVLFLHAPLASQVPLQASSSRDFTLLHWPRLPTTLQAWQAPLQLPLQQTPSRQDALMHSLASWQDVPAPFWGRHAPVESQ